MASLTSVETSYGSGSRPLGPLTWAALRAMDTSGLRAGDFVEVSDLGYSHWLWTGTVWRPRAPVLLDGSSVAAVAPNNTAENVLATVTIPGWVMGLNGRIQCRSFWSVTNSANNKTIRMHLGGIAGPAFTSVVFTTTSGMERVTTIANRGATNSQFGGPASLYSMNNTGAQSMTAALDSTVAQDLVFTGQKALATETITLESREVWILP